MQPQAWRRLTKHPKKTSSSFTSLGKSLCGPNQPSTCCKRADFGVKTGAGVPACMSRGAGTGKAQPFAVSGIPALLRPACAAGTGSHSRLATFGCWSRGRGSPPHTPGPMAGACPRAGWYLLDFLGEVLGDDPSFHLLLLVFACREGQHPTSPPHREIIFSPTNNNKTQQESFPRSCFPSPVQTLPSGEDSESLSYVGKEMPDTAHPYFQWEPGVSQAAKSWGLRKSPKM